MDAAMLGIVLTLFLTALLLSALGVFVERRLAQQELSSSRSQSSGWLPPQFDESCTSDQCEDSSGECLEDDSSV